jgi:3,4-dihydroxy 2-butanone 4-phosphate synthase
VADDLAERLGLHPMVKDNECPLKTPFTVTIDARAGITTGVSVQDRTVTIRRVVADDARPEDFVRPGHVFPLRAHPRGLLARTGHTEGSVALVALAGMKPAAVISEIMNPDGSMARRPDLDAFARSHRIPICTTSSVLHLLRNTPSVPGR